MHAVRRDMTSRDAACDDMSILSTCLVLDASTRMYLDEAPGPPILPSPSVSENRSTSGLFSQPQSKQSQGFQWRQRQWPVAVIIQIQILPTAVRRHERDGRRNERKSGISSTPQRALEDSTAAVVLVTTVTAKVVTVMRRQGDGVEVSHSPRSPFSACSLFLIIRLLTISPSRIQISLLSFLAPAPAPGQTRDRHLSFRPRRVISYSTVTLAHTVTHCCIPPVYLTLANSRSARHVERVARRFAPRRFPIATTRCQHASLPFIPTDIVCATRGAAALIPASSRVSLCRTTTSRAVFHVLTTWSRWSTTSTNTLFGRTD